MGSQEERDNFFSLALLLFRVGNHKLREYFKTQWLIVYQRVIPGTVPPPWQDTPHDATELKKIQPTKLKFKFKDEETKFNSGNTNDWDFSLLTSVLKYSSLHFVLPSSPEEKALDDLKAIRNTLIGHATDAAIPNAVFNTAWTDACNALALFNASAADFKSVQDDVKKPLDVLYPMLQQCVQQEKEIQDSVDTVINRLQKLQQTVEKQHTTLQETVEKQHTTLQETVEKQQATLQTVEKQNTTLQQTVEKQHTTLQETVEKQHTTLQTVEKQNTTLQQTVEKQHTTLQETVEKQNTTLQETVEKQHTTLQQTVEKQHTTLQQTVEKQHTTLQQTVEKQHTTLQETVEKQHTTLQETVEKQQATLQTVEKQNTTLQQTVEKQHTTLQQTVEKQQATLQTVEKQNTTLQQTVEKQHTTLQQTVEKQQATLQTVEKQNTTLQQTVEKQHTTLQQTVEKQQATLQTVEKQHETQVEAVGRIERKVDLMLDQGQQGQKRSSTEVQSGEDVQTKKPRTASDNRERDHAENSNKLKEAIKGNTQNQPKFLDAHDVTSAKTDDIFTNLTVYYADKKQVKKEQPKGLSRGKQLQEYTKRTAGFKVKKCEDIFIDKKRENPKTLLLSGKPGIGKTLFCDKVMRDWSMNRLFGNEDTLNIKFAYLLKFRQLSSHGDKELNLHELLNCCPLLDDKSYVDDSLFEYLTKNPSEVLIILDGFDEYSEQHRKQIASDFEEKYPNDALAKMPIPALCSKLFKGKVFKNSVVLVCSRPGEAEDLRKINVDRYVEISGFSPEQVTEYVDKYFSEPEKERTKNTVREHVEKNENLVSFCHIPLLSFLLCWCLEWRITQSGMTENLPAKITDLYDEVVKVFVQKLHALLKYLEMSENTEKVAQETLDKLAELAANLLKESKYIFDEDDMIKLKLSQDEIENLKVSGILHCVPGIRISAFETKAEYSFTHLTLQEYLSASFFIKKKEIPDKKKVSGQTLVFMSGCLRGKDVKLLEKLIQQITPKDEDDHVNKLLMLQCLYEYGEDKLTELTINNLYDKYCNSYGSIRFRRVTDVDMKYMSYLLDVIHLLKEQHPQSYSDYTLDIINSPLTSFGVGVVCDSLVRNSFITVLGLNGCSLDDKCVEKITDSLVNTGITYLRLDSNNITYEGAESICRVIIQDDCHVEELVLLGNEKMTAECKKRVKELVQKHKPGVILHI